MCCILINLMTILFLIMSIQRNKFFYSHAAGRRSKGDCLSFLISLTGAAMSHLQIRELSPEVALVAKTELNENPSKIGEDIEYLRKWLQMQQHIVPRTDDQFLVSFLRGCKYSYEKSKEKLDMYFTVRSAIPEFFYDRDPSYTNLKEAISRGVTLPLPIPEKYNSSRVMLIRHGVYDPQKLGIEDVMKVAYMINDILIMEDDFAIVCGQTILIDLRGLTLSHVGQCTPSIIKKMTHSIQEAYPVRQKGIHFVNPSSIFDAVFKIFYNFMSSKIKKRIFVHDSFESLYKHINKEILPTEYGGNAGSVQSIADEWQRKLMEKRDWFIDDGKYKTDESKRLVKSSKNEELFGTVGSFRKLEVD
ncbi:Alpha-tocopherol transfer protein-like [Pseudolycoriella hygida]|uniref:Alpha-tocopherol transfer protein-like n=1 Tax=Pseudolycoriella hygida TaxID=35572 RepID=A0A9Q0S549_9DIPT|nr:Alpha-tocopherol transfer protein-like [Pseudolycoriella hygida]